MTLKFELFSVFILLVLFAGCTKKSDYEKLLYKERMKDSRTDTIFLNYYFGMPAEDFFNHSWNLNRNEIVTGQQTIQYNITDLKSQATMSFFPLFKNGKIFKMPVEIYYDGWSPWNKSLFADSLIVDLTNLYNDKYDSDFILTIHPEHNKTAYIDINSNRQISIYKNDDRTVHIEFLDLSTID